MGRPRTGRPTYVRGRWIARVKLRDGRYSEVVLTRDHKPLTGKGVADRAFAKRLAAYYQRRYDEGGWSPAAEGAPEPSKLKLSEWCLRWLEGQTYRTVEHDRARVARWIDRGGFGKLPLAEVTPQGVAAWLRALREAPVPEGRLAPRTVRNISDPVARALRAAVFEGLLSADPFAVLPTAIRPKAEDKDPLARAGYRYTRTQVETLLREPSVRDHWRVLWCLAVFTGARVSELIALRWADLEEDTPLRRVLITRQVHYKTREAQRLKVGDQRQIPEHPTLRAALEEWRSRGWPETYGRAPRAEDLLVPSQPQVRAGGTVGGPSVPLQSNSVYRALQTDLEACCLPRHRTHDFRHTFASLCADAGMDGAVAERWTHKPGGATARRLYLAPSWERQCAEMAKLSLEPP